MMSKKVKVVSFSGGRTSAYLVWLMEKTKLHGEKVVYLFMDTGAEHQKTYDFIRAVAKKFNVEIICLRVDVNPELGKANGYRVVPIDEIGPDLQPWADMIKKYGVPYFGGPFCTDRMKLGPFTKYCNENFGKGSYETWLGIRADEPKRISEKDGIRYLAEISDFDKQDVISWWGEQDFDLEIDEWLGNCVFCMKKSDLKLAAAQRDEPGIYIDFLECIYSTEVRTGVGTGSADMMYRKKRSLQQVIATFDGSSGAEIKERIRGGGMLGSGSCSESCEPFNCQLDLFG